MDDLAAHHQARVERALALVAALNAAAPPEGVGCYGHMRLRTGARERDVLVGARTLVAGGVTLVDWRSAPLAEVFFSHAEGDDYEIESEERVLTGTLVERSLWTIERGELVAIETPEVRLTRGDEDRWHEAPRTPPLLDPRDEAARAHADTLLEAPLDPAQRRTVELPAGRPLLVLGEAGSGKTTVALRRLAHLRRTLGAERLRRAAVIVPTEGLRRFTLALLERLDLGDVEVWLYDRWAAAQARRAFPELPTEECQDPRSSIMRLKRHPSLRGALAKLVSRRRGQRGAPGPFAKRRDLLHLFGDRALLDELVAASAGGVRAGDVAEVLEHTHVQFSRGTEAESRHIDKDRLITIDGQRIDAGTPLEDAGRIDVEDYAVLFEIERLRAAALGARPVEPVRYDCLVLDEAQEFASLELALIGRALVPGGTLIVAGDSAQQVDPGAAFVDWPTTMRDLGAVDHDASELEVSYRCPPDVTELARRLRPPLAVAERAALPADSRAVRSRRFPSECHLAASLVDSLRELRSRDPLATVAIVARTVETARRLAHVVGWGLDLHLVEHGEFRFAPGAQVTTVDEVKGLEFDDVVLPDASAQAYPETDAARRALYVAVTRTIHQLLLATVGTPTNAW